MRVGPSGEERKRVRTIRLVQDRILDSLLLDFGLGHRRANGIDQDRSGPPGNTLDEAKMEAEFSDPQGNRYRVELDHVVNHRFLVTRLRVVL